jgi:hypothetical protein
MTREERLLAAAVILRDAAEQLAIERAAAQEHQSHPMAA